MPDYTDHAEVLRFLEEDQDADRDQRQKAREAHLFIKAENGQWEPYWWDAQDGAPRYTFDQTTPIVNRVAGAIDKSDFGINITPSGGQASIDVAKTYQGLIRNIQNISNAVHVFNQAGRAMVTGGISGWRVVQKFVDDNSFDQDLVIEPISNYLDRVWFDYGSEMQDKSDATRCYVLQSITRNKYEEKWPDRNAVSVDDGREATAFSNNQADFVTVGELYYVLEVERELVLYSNGATYEVNDDFKKIQDELKLLGVEEQKRRTRKKKEIWIRKFDGDGWLEPAKKTVFSWIPVAATMANFEIFENHIIYFGVVEKLMDPQRILNYSASREIAEGALAPREKFWLTEAQGAGHEHELASLNVNQDPFQYYTHVEGVPPPFKTGGAQVNPGLARTTEFAKQSIGEVASLFAANMGDNPDLQSGVAIKELKASGDIGNIQYVTPQEVAICHTWRILKDAIPKVYTPGRQVKILAEDGTSEMVTIGEEIIDQDTGTPLINPQTGQQVFDPQTGRTIMDPATQDKIMLNDLNQGLYDVTCVAGPSFKSQQSETVAAIAEIGRILPEALQASSDILLSNIAIPGFKDIAARQRAQLLKAQIIPVDQMTDDEKAEAEAAAQQPPQPDAGVLLAQAEQTKADADMAKVQLESQIAQFEAQKQSAELQLRAKKLDIEEKQQELDFAKAQAGQGTQEIKNILAIQEQQRKELDSQADRLNTQADTIKKLREGFGVESFTGPGTAETIIQQADIVGEAQDLV